MTKKCLQFDLILTVRDAEKFFGGRKEFLKKAPFLVFVVKVHSCTSQKCLEKQCNLAQILLTFKDSMILF